MQRKACASRRSLLLGGAGLWLGSTAVPARACEVQAEFLRVVHPWTRATVPGASTGVLCVRIDQVTGDDRLIGVETPVAGGAEMGGLEPGQPVDVPLAAGTELEMHERGVHLRLRPLRMVLHAGRSYPLHLTFERSGVVIATLSVDFERFA